LYLSANVHAVVGPISIKNEKAALKGLSAR